MRAVKLKHGVIFAERNGITLKFVPEKGWSVSPIMLDVLLWDLRGEGLDAYEYLFESDLRGLGDEAWQKMLQLFEKTEEVFGL